MIQNRKNEHLEICGNRDVEFKRTSTLFENVHLVHEALPELDFAEIDTSTKFMGKKLRAPLLISAMTGGVENARKLNHDLARVAGELGLGFCLGSQRPMLENKKLADSFKVREAAGDALVLGNLGIQQAARTDPKEVEKLISGIDADGIAIHLNPAMELSQAEGDTNFSNGYKTLTSLTRLMPRRIMVKETGCGISTHVGARLREAGVQILDTAGAGGTSWTRVERIRGDAGDGENWMDEWGIPTAASLLEVSRLGFELVGSGGVRSGLDVAKCLVLGANTAGMALPVLRAYLSGGYDGVIDFLNGIIKELKTVMLLTGANDITTLKKHSPVISGRLSEWMNRKK